MTESQKKTKPATSMSRPVSRMDGDKMFTIDSDDRDRKSEMYSTTTRERLVRLAYRFLWNRDDAEDVVRDALTIAHTRAGELREGNKWWAWLSRIVVHRCHEHGRRKRRNEQYIEALAQASNRRAVDAPVVRSGLSKEDVRRMLWQLPNRQREVLVLRHLEGLSSEKVADLLGIAPATVRVHAQAARESLLRLIRLERSADRAGLLSRERESL